jgi:hypothetical protein
VRRVRTPGVPGKGLRGGGLARVKAAKWPTEDGSLDLRRQSRRIAARSACASKRQFETLEHRVGMFAEINRLGYPDVMYATAVVEGKVVRFRLSPALARAHRENRGRTMTDQEAVAFVERKRRARALRRARPYLESRS